jgi:hypothetical protein
MIVEKRDARCKAIAKSGKPCRAAATESGSCFFHAHPNKAAELGSIGGKRNRRPGAASADPLPPMDCAKTIIENLDRIYNEVRTGAIAPKVATTLLHVITAKERFTDKMVIERQMAAMQDDLRTLKSMIQIRNIEALTSENEEPES